MRSTLRVTLFGGLGIAVEPAEQLKFVSIRAELFLAWLVMNPGVHRRERVADLLWDERDQGRSLGNLRTLLSRMPKAIKPFLQTSTQTIGIDPAQDIQIDLLEFDQLIETQQPVKAEALLTGEILAGVFVDESEGLDEWMLRLREAYQQKSIDLLVKLTDVSLTEREFGQGVLYAQKLVQLDPLREASYRALMQLLARNGRRGEALKVFERCEQMLHDEFGLMPEEETFALADRVRGRAGLRHNLPAQPTPFIGRTKELTLLRELFLAQNQRMVTIVGVGGMGKTRLSLACGELLAADFMDGVAFVQLEGIERAELVGTTISATLAENGFISANTTNQPAAQYLSQHLKEKELLLLLDNFDHLLDAAPLLTDVLNQTTSLKILVTSRSRLGLRWEQLLDLNGLDYSAKLSDETWLMADAVQLFLQMGQQLSSVTDLSMADRAALTEICRIVDGMPLALELAARTVRLYSYQEILAKISQNIDYLSTTDRDIPDRHRSIQAAFEYSWQQLSPDECTVLGQLSVFSGGFDANAAIAVADLTDRHLLSLLDKSLIQRAVVTSNDTATRYMQHPLLREFSWEKLAADPTELDEMRTRHAQHYLSQVANFQLRQREDSRSLDHFVNQNLDNIHAAWRWGVEQELWSSLLDVSTQMANYWHRYGLNQEGLYNFEAAAQGVSLETDSETKLRFELEKIRFLGLVGEYERAIEEIKRVLSAIEDETTVYHAELEVLWGEYLYFRSAYAEAKEKLNHGLQLAESLKLELVSAWAYRHLSAVAMDEGNYSDAEMHAHAAHALFEQCESIEGTARTFAILSIVANLRGEYDDSIKLSQQAIALCETFGDYQTSLNGKGNLAFLLTRSGRFDDALRYVDDTLNGYSEYVSLRGRGHSFYVKGVLMARMGRYPLAVQLLKNSLELRQQIRAVRPNVFTCAHLVMVYENCAQPNDAMHYAEEAVQTSEQFDDAYMNQIAYLAMGYARLARREAEKAKEAFQQSLAFALQRNALNGDLDMLSGVIEADLLGGHVEEARQQAQRLAKRLTPAVLPASLQPFRIYYTCYRALQKENPELAAQLSEQALEGINSWAANLPDEASRETFRSAVPAHRSLGEIANG